MRLPKETILRTICPRCKSSCTREDITPRAGDPPTVRVECSDPDCTYRACWVVRGKRRYAVPDPCERPTPPAWEEMNVSPYKWCCRECGKRSRYANGLCRECHEERRKG